MTSQSAFNSKKTIQHEFGRFFVIKFGTFDEKTFKAQLSAFLTKVVSFNIYSNRKVQNSHVFLYILVLALMFLPATMSTETCAKKIGLHTYRHRNCIPQRRIAPVCSGSCRSYSMTSRDNPYALQTSCTCCQAVEFITTGLSVKCPLEKPDGIRVFHRVTVQVRIPRSCMCRPCTFETPMKSEEESLAIPDEGTLLNQPFTTTTVRSSTSASPVTFSEESQLDELPPLNVEESSSNATSVDSGIQTGEPETEIRISSPREGSFKKRFNLFKTKFLF